ncbi:50S ribosomal protein L29 [Candidatus Endowatersipora endosymbiont of Watersipora subatra]|uniref:50S ribosomal protein L29 n=1 Tax=Candidatus Endowatersipora endosymbiont of Watersipora subatra TaxID=3077946 RepID=UPI00312C9A32
MKSHYIREMTREKMKEELVKLKKEQFNLRFQRASGQLKNTVQMRKIRRDIARLYTIISVKETDSLLADV